MRVLCGLWVILGQKPVQFLLDVVSRKSVSESDSLYQMPYSGSLAVQSEIGSEDRGAVIFIFR